ncbi:Arginine permease [Lachnellula occidentalis]|uniref:Arginine permease n=1 Tax=Lachnellula occidentalis TaxID=215460 RepID=A0A8H8UG45_9HELO|nr:Arginine permease [Lachnellula occidentalis]
MASIARDPPYENEKEISQKVDLDSDFATDNGKLTVDETISYVAGKHETAGLRRSLNGRHMYMLSIASGIGTGLFLGSGSALYSAGPLGLLLGYIIQGFIAAAVAYICAETIGYLPVSGGFIRFVPKFSDRALGITIGYTFWYLLSITTAAEIGGQISIAPFLFQSELLPVKAYGETEFFFGMLKTLMIFALIFAGLLVDWGVSPSGRYIGGENWHTPINEYLVKGATGRFLAVWNVLINAAFAMGNIQITCSAAGETKDPRVQVPKAMRRVFWRLLIFYIASLLVVGLILPSKSPQLLVNNGSASSPFILAFTAAGIKVFPSVINAIVITSAFSSGNGVLFLASRTLVGLAQDGFAPQFLLRTNRFGSPWIAVLVSFILAPLAYLNCGKSTPTVVFGWFINLIATAGLIIWCAICFTYVRFYYGLKHQGISRDDLPYKSWGQPWSAIAAGFMCFLIVFFSGFSVFFPHMFSAATFLSNYIACFVVPAVYIILKLTIKSPWITYDMMEFTEMPAIRAEQAYKDAQPKTKQPIWRKLIEKTLDE